ncbi:Myb-like_DNA-binding domain-containing protein [Hexamita inflata]|uniref:Myb-like DNA-binding domain-containing protein n=1 Tax=Hexamita inflata TaxID=28002 RepID=A0AA86PG24_9EUKA|nr:Myb-like DNA-binding domain-containing protein [Hexamita inflata]
MCRTWSDNDIKRLIDIVESQTDYTINKVNWINVQRYFQDRTAQQCKSFYCNKIRPFIFTQNGLRKSDVKFVHRCYFYLVQRPLSEPNEQLEQKVGRILAEQCWNDMLNAYVNQGEFKPSKKLLQGALCMVKYHFKHELEITNAIKMNGKYEKYGYTVTKDKWNEFQALSEKHNAKQLMQFIETQLSKMQ